MEPQSDRQNVEQKNMRTPKTTCAHGRLVDAIRTERGTRTGKVRCLECGAIIQDPHHSQRS